MIKNYNLSSIKKNNKIDSIPYRINIIKELMDGTQLETMVDYDMHDTEYYEKPDKYFDIDEDQSKNTRQVLNKKVLDFYKSNFNYLVANKNLNISKFKKERIKKNE